MNCSKFCIYLILNAVLVIVSCAEFGSFNESDFSSVSSKKVLSRKRRYLTFPDGSSLQLVYDYVIPIYGMPQIFILGITVSMAWQLPSEPFRKHGLGGDDGGDAAPAPAPAPAPVPTAPDHHDDHSYPFYDHADKRKDNLKPIYVSTSNKKPMYYISDKNRYNGLYNKYTGKPAAPYFGSGSYQYNKYNKPFYRIKATRAPKRRIYPVFAKRSIADDEPTPVENNDSLRNIPPVKHTEHHRRQRRDLFGKIETFFTSQGKQGPACVFKAICEASQKSRSGDQGSFFEEIMKAIFSLPDGEEFDNHQHRQYDEARKIEEDCAQKYHTCGHSVFDKENHQFAM